MDANRTPQPRIRAVTPLRPTLGDSFQVDPGQEQIDAVQRIGQESFANAARQVVASNQTNSATIGQIAENIIGQDRAIQLSQQYQRARSGSSTIDDITNLVKTGFEVYSGIQQRKQERRRSEALLQFSGEKERLIAEAANIVRDPQQGSVAYDRRVRQLLTQAQQSGLDADNLIAFTAELYEPLRDLNAEEAQATHGTFQQIQDNRLNTAVAGSNIQLNGLYAQMVGTNNVEQIEGLTVQAQTLITQQAEALAQQSPTLAMSFVSQQLEQLATNYGDNLGRVGGIVRHLESYEVYLRDHAPVVRDLYNQGRFDEAEERRQLGAASVGLSIGDLPDPMAGADIAHTFWQRDQLRRDADRQGIMDAGQMLEFDTQQTLSLAAGLIADPINTMRWIRSNPGLEDNPSVLAAQELSELFADYQDGQLDVQAQQIQLQQSLNAIDRQTNQTLLSSIRDPNTNISELLLPLTIASRFDSGLESAIGQLQQQQGNLQTEQQRQEFLEQYIEIQQEAKDLLTRELQVADARLGEQRRLLDQYGIRSPEQLNVLLESAPETLQQMTETLQQQIEQNRQNMGLTPNFSLPDLATTTNSAGVQAVLPFISNTSAPITGHVGESRHNGPHAGLDFGIPEGTPIVFYTQGEVIEARNKDGYGLTIDIRSPDGHIHRFAHLSDMQVSVGQTVFPGQRIALSGSTGVGTGPHLHWEVRRPGGALYGRYNPNDVMDPLEYTAGLELRPRQQRTAGGSSGYVVENNQEYASVDLNDYRGRANNRGDNFGYMELASDNAYRNRLHQVAENIGIPTQWLADVIAYESGHNAAVWNRGGAPAVGLIQFYDDTGRGRNGAKTIGGRTYSLTDIARMSRVQQLDLVEAYIREAQPPGGYRSPYELLVGIFAGPGRLRRFRDNPNSILGMSDGDITVAEYLNRLGSNAGRRYQPLRPEPIRTR